MKRTLFAAAIFAACPLPATAGETITISPGPGFSTRINTPWGTFIADDTPSGIWVGTEKEWTDSVARGVATKNGDREVHLPGQKRDGLNFVHSGSEAVMGSIHLYNIEAYSLIGVPPSAKLHRPKPPKGYENFGLVWIPQERLPIQANLSIDGRTIAPLDCTTSENFRACEFAVPRADLTKAVKVVFLLKGRQPGVTEFQSLARKAADDIVAKYRSLKGIAISDEDRTDLARLHEIDPNLPADLTGH
ncbi:MAG: hypothetical protein P4M15_06145 [Alphaproteobacteria bacterium]|nr:hypothetical protein [Alphaproteobacteria bacterium]